MIRTFLIYLPATLLPRIAAFATILAGTRLLAPSEYGMFSLVIVIGEFADMAFTNWVRIATSRFGATPQGISFQFARRMALLASCCTLAAVAISTAVARIVAADRFEESSAALAAYIGANALARFGVTLYQAMERHRRASALESVRAALVLTATLGAMAATRQFLYASLAASAANLSVGAIASVAGLAAADRQLPDVVPVRRVLAFAIPLIVLALLSQAISSLDKALLKRFQDSATLGLYAAAFAVGRAGFDAIAVAFNTGAFVQLSALFNAGQGAKAQDILSKQLAYIPAIALPAAGFVIAARSAIAEVIFPPEYYTTFVVVIPYVVLGAVALNLKNFVFDNIFHMHLRNLRQIPTLVVGACGSVVVAIIVFPVDPILGAGLMFAVGGLSALIASVAMTTSLTRVPLPWRAIGSAMSFGASSWGLATVLAMALDGVPAPGILAAQFLVGGLAVVSSLLIAHLIMEPRGPRLALAFITANPHRVTGLSSYAESLIEALCKQGNRPAIVFLTNARREVFPRLASAELEWVHIRSRPRWVPYKLYVVVAHNYACWAARQRSCGCYISTTPAGATFPVLAQTVTIHDLYDLNKQLTPWRTRVFTRFLWRWLARVSRSVVCVSGTTANEARRFLPPRSGNKITIIKEASKFSADAPSEVREGASFLYVANVQPVKNVECLLNALQRSRGGIRVDWIGWDVSGIVSDWERRNGTPPGFRALGSVSDSELRTAYEQAKALIVTSWKEGFCLPILEAHAFGVPVIASDIPILREVAGEGAIYFDPRSPDSLLAAMERVSNSAEVRDELSRAAFANSKLYSWDRAAVETLQLLRKDSTR